MGGRAKTRQHGPNRKLSILLNVSILFIVCRLYDIIGKRLAREFSRQFVPVIESLDAFNATKGQLLNTKPKLSYLIGGTYCR